MATKQVCINDPVPAIEGIFVKIKKHPRINPTALIIVMFVMVCNIGITSIYTYAYNKYKPLLPFASYTYPYVRYRRHSERTRRTY